MRPIEYSEEADRKLQREKIAELLSRNPELFGKDLEPIREDLRFVLDKMDQVSGAPARKAIAEMLAGDQPGSVGRVLNQFTESNKTAPTWGQLADQAGIENEYGKKAVELLGPFTEPNLPIGPVFGMAKKIGKGGKLPPNVINFEQKLAEREANQASKSVTEKPEISGPATVTSFDDHNLSKVADFLNENASTHGMPHDLFKALQDNPLISKNINAIKDVIASGKELGVDVKFDPHNFQFISNGKRFELEDAQNMMDSLRNKKEIETLKESKKTGELIDANDDFSRLRNSKKNQTNEADIVDTDRILSKIGDDRFDYDKILKQNDMLSGSGKAMNEANRITDKFKLESLEKEQFDRIASGKSPEELSDALRLLMKSDPLAKERLLFFTLSRPHWNYDMLIDKLNNNPITKQTFRKLTPAFIPDLNILRDHLRYGSNRYPYQEREQLKYIDLIDETLSRLNKTVGKNQEIRSLEKKLDSLLPGISDDAKDLLESYKNRYKENKSDLKRFLQTAISTATKNSVPYSSGMMEKIKSGKDDIFIPNFRFEIKNNEIGIRGISHQTALGSDNIDPLNWADTKFMITKNALAKQTEPIRINTSSDLIARDDYKELIPKGSKVYIYGLSDNGHFNRLMFPGNPSQERLKSAYEKLKSAGIDVTLVRPTVDEFIDRAAMYNQKKYGKDPISYARQRIGHENPRQAFIDDGMQQAVDVDKLKSDIDPFGQNVKKTRKRPKKSTEQDDE